MEFLGPNRWLLSLETSLAARGEPGRGSPHMKGVGMLFVSLRDVNFWFLFSYESAQEGYNCIIKAKNIEYSLKFWLARTRYVHFRLGSKCFDPKLGFPPYTLQLFWVKLVTSLATVQYQFSTTAEKCNGGKHGGGRGRVDGRGNWGKREKCRGVTQHRLTRKV